jgi:inosine-uridine nucleoside N-ribohydrolase
MHDAMAVYEAIDSTKISKKGVQITVETGGTHARGATFISTKPEFANAKVQVGVTVDNDVFVATLVERLRTFS